MSEKPTEGSVIMRIGEFALTALTSYHFVIEDETWSASLGYFYIHSDEAQKELDKQALSKVVPSAKFTFILPDGKQYSGIGHATKVEINDFPEGVIKKYATIAGEGCLTITD